MLSRSTRHLRSARRALLIAGIGITLGACAQGGASLAPQIGQKVPDSYNPGQPYQLSREELSLDCRKLSPAECRSAFSRSAIRAFAAAPPPWRKPPSHWSRR
jgi:type IV pilus biogenesis protein CpaD/CtpE